MIFSSVKFRLKKEKGLFLLNFFLATVFLAGVIFTGFFLPIFLIGLSQQIKSHSVQPQGSSKTTTAPHTSHLS